MSDFHLFINQQVTTKSPASTFPILANSSLLANTWPDIFPWRPPPVPSQTRPNALTYSPLHLLENSAFPSLLPNNSSSIRRISIFMLSEGNWVLAAVSLSALRMIWASWSWLARSDADRMRIEGVAEWMQSWWA